MKTSVGPTPARPAVAVFPTHAELCAALLSGGARVRFRAPGASMEPTIHHDEVVEVAPAAGADLRVGDIVLSRGPKGLLAHRLIRIEGRGAGARLTTRGDGANGADPSVGAEDVLGRVLSVVRGGRTIALSGPGAALRYRRVRALRLARRLLAAVRRRLP